jgi:hypothetical protein
MGWGHVALMEDTRRAYKVSVRKFEGTVSFGMHRNIMEDNIKIDLKETAWKVLDWVNLTQGGDQWRLL